MSYLVPTRPGFREAPLSGNLIHARNHPVRHAIADDVKHTLAICAIVKNEHDYLLEWMAYHRVVGVDHFLIYNNSSESDDGTTRLLSKLHASGSAEVVSWPDRPEWKLPTGVYLRPQIPAYHDGLRRLREDAEWVAFIDVDEFIVPMQDQDVPSALKRYSQFGGVAANWRTFGTSGLREKGNGPVCERFTKASLPENRVNLHVKCIARTALIRDLGIHRPFLKGGVLVDEHGREMRNSSGFRYPVTYDVLRINHYYTKSWSEWLAKVARGRASHPKKREKSSISEADFNDETDTSILKFYPAVVEVMKELAESANIENYPSLIEVDSLARSGDLRPASDRTPSGTAGIAPGTPILDVHLVGSFANRMVQYMVAQRIAGEVEDCVLSNAVLPEWKIDHPLLPGELGPEIHPLKSEQQADIDRITEALRTLEKPRVTFRPDLCWLSNFPDLASARKLFPASHRDYPGFGPEYLVCDLHAPEMSDGAQMHHVLLPVKFYEEIAHRMQLKLAFIGHGGQTAYVRTLQQQFPDAEFQSSRGNLHDFQTIMNSTNVVLAVGVFSWLAAWLSQAQHIVMPIDGLFHPIQEPNLDLIPVADDRYEFHLFPINYAAPEDRFEDVHRNLEWHRVTREEVTNLRKSGQPRRLDSFVSAFDETFYLRTYQDVANAVKGGGLRSSLDHYVKCGFREGRNGFAFDQLWYSVTYPQAAWEVGQGQYCDLRHHYVEVGARRGYKPMPDSAK